MLLKIYSLFLLLFSFINYMRELRHKDVINSSPKFKQLVSGRARMQIQAICFWTINNASRIVENFTKF